MLSLLKESAYRLGDRMAVKLASHDCIATVDARMQVQSLPAQRLRCGVVRSLDKGQTTIDESDAVRKHSDPSRCRYAHRTTLRWRLSVLRCVPVDHEQDVAVFSSRKAALRNPAALGGRRAFVGVVS